MTECDHDDDLPYGLADARSHSLSRRPRLRRAVHCRDLPVAALRRTGKGSDRQRRLANFVEAFFAKIQAFHQAPRHPKWREVNLAAEVPGWRQFVPARLWLERRTSRFAVSDDPRLKADFDRFAKAKDLSGEEQEKIFEEFLRWRERVR